MVPILSSCLRCKQTGEVNFKGAQGLKILTSKHDRSSLLPPSLCQAKHYHHDLQFYNEESYLRVGGVEVLYYKPQKVHWQLATSHSSQSPLYRQVKASSMTTITEKRQTAADGKQ